MKILINYLPYPPYYTLPYPTHLINNLIINSKKHLFIHLPTLCPKSKLGHLGWIKSLRLSQAPRLGQVA
jgi:hypothetical protein